MRYEERSRLGGAAFDPSYFCAHFPASLLRPLRRRRNERLRNGEEEEEDGFTFVLRARFYNFGCNMLRPIARKSNPIAIDTVATTFNIRLPHYLPAQSNPIATTNSSNPISWRAKGTLLRASYFSRLKRSAT